jgi:hypothetical protein
MAEFSFKDIRVRLLGRDVVGLQGITYKNSVEKEYVYGRGNQPLGIQHGNAKVEGTLSILQSEFEALQAAIKASNPLLNITDVTFDIVNTYGDGLTAKTDIILTASVTEYEKGMQQNDKFKVIELPFLALGVQEGV